MRPFKAIAKKAKHFFEESEKPAEEVKAASYSVMASFTSIRDRIEIVFGLLCAIVSGILYPLVLVIGGFIADLYLQKTSKINNIDFYNKVMQYILLGISLGSLQMLVTFWQTLFIERATKRVINNLRCEYLRAVMRHDASWTDANSSASLICRLNQNVDIISDGLANKGCLLLRYSSMFLSSVVICSVICWQLTIVCVWLGPLSAMVLSVMGRVLEKPSQNTSDLCEKANCVLEEAVVNVRTVQTSNAQKFMLEKQSKILQKASVCQQTEIFLFGFFDGMSLFVVYLCTGLSLFYGCYIYFENQYCNAGDVILIVNTTCVTGYFLGLLGPHRNAVRLARTAFSVLIGTIDMKKNEDKSGTRFGDVRGHIEFRNVHFRYLNRPSPVLQGVSFEAKPGETIALVGASGCGKSTSVGLLSKMYRATMGEVLFDGENIDKVDGKSLRSKMGIVQQEPRLFACSVRENILLGRKVSEEELIEAVKTANAFDFIQQLSEGFDTKLGSGGVQLSGGQKQRLCVARALIDRPKVLVLDEATSALDSHSERIVQNALYNASQGRTTIVIAHRISTLKNVDRIYVLEKGKIVEVGTHEELVALNGIYGKLARSQEVEDSVEDGEEKVDKKIEEDIVERKDKATSEYGSISSVEQKELDKNKENKHRLLYGFRRFWPYVLRQKSRLFIVLLASIPRTFEFPLYGYGMYNAFYTLQQSKDVYKYFSYANVTQFTLMGILVWSMHTLILFIDGKLANNVISEVKNDLLRSLLNRRMSFFDKSDTSPTACVAKVTTNIRNSEGCLDQRILRIIWFVCSCVFSLALAAPYSWQIALVAFFFTVFVALAVLILLKKTQNAQNKKSKNDKSAEFVVETIENARSIKLLGCENFFENRFLEELDKVQEYENKIVKYSATTSALTQSYVFFCDMIFFYIGTLLIFHGYSSPQRVYLAFNGAQMAAWGVMYVFPYFPELVRCADAANQIFALFDEGNVDVQDDSKTEIKQGSVSFEKVSFAYPSRPNIPVLDSIEFDVSQGQSIALVGASGGGKSTVISLLERFYEPTAGSIKIDGQDTRNMSIDRMRENIALVGQEPVLFDGTIFENIALGDNSISLVDVKKACAIADAANFIENFPAGYETRVGECGGMLSGGQKQRIAIARAIVRDPKILLLDEATSALDAYTEKVVQNALRKASKGRTCIYVAHRLNTIQHCDMIYYISEGRICEKGSHQHLLSLDGQYSKLVAAQSLQ